MCKPYYCALKRACDHANPIIAQKRPHERANLVIAQKKACDHANPIIAQKKPHEHANLIIAQKKAGDHANPIIAQKRPHDRAHLITAQKRPPTPFVAFGMFVHTLLLHKRGPMTVCNLGGPFIPYNHTKEGSMTGQTLCYLTKEVP
jgi:hypothetical protein